MKRRDSYDHMDRNHTAVNGNYQKQRTNIVSPEFLLGQLWIQEQENTGVKIIELDSNSSNNDLNDDDKDTVSHAWSYINNDRFRIPLSPNNDYNVNYTAREKYRQKNSRHKTDTSQPKDVEKEESCMRNFIYSNMQDSEQNGSANNNYNRSSHKTDCFTNTEVYPKLSDSSTDVEYIDREDLKAEELAWKSDGRYYDEILTYDSNIDAEKRTIYIYSFKNKHHFTENDGTNISNSSSSTSTETSEEQTKDKSNGRVPSPIPDIYVPRLNLLQPTKLPTVTEIAEPNNSEENFKSKYDTKPSLAKPNGWFSNSSHNYQQSEYKCGSDNLINWMSLSPREKRRRSRSTFCDNCKRLARLQMVRETSPIVEDSQSTENNTMSLAQGNMSYVDHKNIKAENEIQVFNGLWEENHVEDRGDHVQNRTFLKPKMQINPKTSGEPTKITEPIEKLDSNNWIGEETVVARDKSSHQFQNVDSVETTYHGEGDVSRRLWENNMVLLKPTEWSAFYPADNSVPSLHLSLETEVEEVTWFRRIIRCLRCFK